MRHAELVKDAGDDEIDEVLDGFDAVIPAGAGGKDDCARFGGAAHVVEVDDREGRFAGDENQLAALLEVDVGRTLNQVVARAVSDAAEGAARARADDHAAGEEGAA